MNLLDKASSSTDQADLIILSHVETIRDQDQPATPSAVASLIGGAPAEVVAKRLGNLWGLQAVEMVPMNPREGFQLTELGAELLRRDLIGWSPSAREDARRTAKLRDIVARGRNWS
jgi:hypothetical protein